MNKQSLRGLVPRWLLGAVLFAILLHSASAHSKRVHLSVETQWADTPLLLELGEVLGSLPGNAFWRFVQAYLPLENYSTPKARFDHFMSLAANVTRSPEHWKLIHYALATRFYNPAVTAQLERAVAEFNSYESDSACRSTDTFAVVSWHTSTVSAGSQLHTKLVCDGNQLQETLTELKEVNTLVRDWGERLPSDHMQGSTQSRVRIVLYANLASPTFLPQYAWLINYPVANPTEGVSLVLRWTSDQADQENQDRVYLQGYGAELALKSTEYRVVDDGSQEGAKNGGDDAEATPIDEDEVLEGLRFHKLLQSYPALSSELRAFRRDILESSSSLRPLKRWEMTDLGIQATFVAEQSSNRWALLRDLTGNFPSLAHNLAKVQVPDDFREGLQEVSRRYGPGREFGTLNGRPLDMRETNPFELYDLMREEISLHNQLEGVDFPPYLIPSAMRLSLTQSQFRLDMRSSAVLWINNLEEDSMYMYWPKTLYELYRPSHPEQMRFIARNIINVVNVLPPFSRDAFDLYPIVQMFYRGRAPIRSAFLFDRTGVTNPALHTERDYHNLSDITEPLEDVFISAYYYLLEQHSEPFKALQFLVSVGSLGSEDVVTLARMNEAFAAQSGVPLLELYKPKNVKKLDKYLEETTEFLSTRGLGGGAQSFCNGVPLKVTSFQNVPYSNAVIQFAQEEYRALAQRLWMREISDQDDVYEAQLSQPGVASSYNRAVLSGESYVPFVALTMPSSVERTSFRFGTAEGNALSHFLAQQIDYVNGGRGEMKFYDITHYLILDLSTDQGLRTLDALLQRFSAEEELEDVRGVRFAVIHNSNEANTLMNDVMNIAGRTIPTHRAKYLSFLQQLTQEVLALSPEQRETMDLFQLMKEKIPGPSLDRFIKHWSQKEWREAVLALHRRFLEQLMPGTYEPGVNYIVTNGRVTELPSELPYLSSHGFRLIEGILRQQGKPLYEMVRDADYSHVIDQEEFQTISKQLSLFRTELYLRAFSILMYHQVHLGRTVEATGFSSNEEIRDVPLSFELVLDPLSKSTRRMAPILHDLEEHFGEELVQIRAIFNPSLELSELPLSSYYRYAVNTLDIPFDQDGYAVPSGVTFTDLPKDSLMSLTMHAPPSWLVQSLVSRYDLDNLLLKDVTEDSVVAQFVLRHLVVQGFAEDVSRSEPPRGTQLVLENAAGERWDTIVMSNSGYFQLKAKPGMWKLQLAQGRSSDLFEMPPEQSALTIDSFTVPAPTIKLSHREGMEHVDSVLDLPVPSHKKDQTIHVFSLASGHLYERFLKIMILSVLRTTESPVKFWFVENFLSPQFKDTVQEMSEQYGFQVELVSYQWPSWLIAQTEKQRVIWAYKILFLDVLFPLDVHRVIFVDADLVVRGDLRELNELDMKGAVYGYTPFCDSREEMEGFRFWKTGFWKEHLSSIRARYHISALYVVDLDLFRNRAIGDQLRDVYNGLSRDPHSLANLDQDLPNFTQNNIPIYSLDQSWLWCETWCSDESKSKAKAIDLCNNPMTKTPKLENAVRIVDEWTELDQEARGVKGSEAQTINPVHELLARSAVEQWSTLRTKLASIRSSDKSEDDIVAVEDIDSFYGIHH